MTNIEEAKEKVRALLLEDIPLSKIASAMKLNVATIRQWAGEFVLSDVLGPTDAESELVEQEFDAAVDEALAGMVEPTVETNVGQPASEKGSSMATVPSWMENLEVFDSEPPPVTPSKGGSGTPAYELSDALKERLQYRDPENGPNGTVRHEDQVWFGITFPSATRASKTITKMRTHVGNLPVPAGHPKRGLDLRVDSPGGDFFGEGLATDKLPVSDMMLQEKDEKTGKLTVVKEDGVGIIKKRGLPTVARNEKEDDESTWTPVKLRVHVSQRARKGSAAPAKVTLESMQSTADEVLATS